MAKEITCESTHRDEILDGCGVVTDNIFKKSNKNIGT